MDLMITRRMTGRDVPRESEPAILVPKRDDTILPDLVARRLDFNPRMPRNSAINDELKCAPHKTTRRIGPSIGPRECKSASAWQASFFFFVFVFFWPNTDISSPHNYEIWKTNVSAGVVPDNAHTSFQARILVIRRVTRVNNRLITRPLASLLPCPLESLDYVIQVPVEWTFYK